MTYVSKLDGSGDRFLSRCLQHILGESWVTPADFVASFGPADIIEALEGATELRARILIEAAGVHEKIAPKKSTQAAAEDLQISLDEGICDAPRLLELFSADDRVRYLDRQRLWDFVTRDQFWTKPSEKARARMVFVIATALEEKLIDLGAVIDGVGSERLAKDLPKGLLEQVLVRAVSEGRGGKPLDPAMLFEVVKLPDWVAHVSLEHLWQNVVQSRVESVAGFDDEDGIALVSDSDIAPADGDEPPPGSGPNRSQGKGKGSGKAPPAKGKGGAGSSAKAAGGAPEASAVSPVDGERDAAELAARQRAVDTLTKIGRLPPRHEALDTPTLLAIDSLYVDLAPLTTDEAREECIREAFPNDAMLRGALLALAEVLDPNIDIAALEKEADADSLIKLVLFEERRKADRSRRSLTPPPPAGAAPASGRGSSAPPPLPPLPPPTSGQRPSSPPPPLPEAAGAPPGRR